MLMEAIAGEEAVFVWGIVIAPGLAMLKVKARVNHSHPSGIESHSEGDGQPPGQSGQLGGEPEGS
jgi:hypothetical protein